jgi:hypothetical protein
MFAEAGQKPAVPRTGSTPRETGFAADKRFIVRRLPFVAGLVALAGSIGSSAQVSQQVLVGILEDNPGRYEGDAHHRTVRVAFRRERGAWVAFPNNCPDPVCVETIAASFPSQVNWTISFDGKRLGQVTGRTPPSFDLYATVGQQQILENGAPPPTVGKPSEEFAGFLDEPVYRPLVAISTLNYRNPDGWKRSRPRDDVARALRAAFRMRYPKVENCTTADDQPQPWKYQDTNIDLKNVYASARGWLIAEVVLSESKCDGPAEEPFWSHWFVVTPERQIRFLDSNMWLVDAGDYDNDGRSELVFSIDGYNHGGYRLFYDDFTRKAVFEFSYH